MGLSEGDSLNDAKKAYTKIAEDGRLDKNDAVNIDTYLKESADLKDETNVELNNLLGEVIDLSLKHRGFLVESDEDINFLRETFKKLNIQGDVIPNYSEIKTTFPESESFVLYFDREAELQVKGEDFTDFGIIVDGKIKKFGDNILSQLYAFMNNPTNIKEANNIGDIHIDRSHIKTKDILALIDKVGEGEVSVDDLTKGGGLSTPLVLGIAYGNPLTRKLFFGGK